MIKVNDLKELRKSARQKRVGKCLRTIIERYAREKRPKEKTYRSS